jgi:hypothetical protein
MSSTVRHAAVIAAICAICALPLPALALDSGADAPNAGGASWSFRVLLDGKPIGQHQFRATDGAGERTLVSEAAFSVRLLGVTLYQYQHRAVERWRGDCLLALSADTDDNGERTRVSARALGEQFEVTAPVPQTERGCVMSFAYWNPALRAQQAPAERADRTHRVGPRQRHRRGHADGRKAHGQRIRAGASAARRNRSTCGIRRKATGSGSTR